MTIYLRYGNLKIEVSGDRTVTKKSSDMSFPIQVNTAHLNGEEQFSSKGSIRSELINNIETRTPTEQAVAQIVLDMQERVLSNEKKVEKQEDELHMYIKSLQAKQTGTSIIIKNLSK